MKKKALQFAIGLFIISNGAFAQWGGSTTTFNDTYRNGKVGIGTSTPSFDIHVVSPAMFLQKLEGTGMFTGIMFKSNNSTKQFGFHFGTDGTNSVNTNSLRFGRYGLGGDSYGANYEANPVVLDLDAPDGSLVLTEDGKVGIGTQNPGSFKLAVEGKIGAREIQVTLTNPFPDYVFDSKYKLRSLSSLENYINENKHLPNVPSAAEVEKNGGIELGQMNTKLLEKVEELTLYIIEINKKVEKLEKENEALKKAN